MNEPCFTVALMAGKLFRGMLGLCDARIPSASGSPLSLKRDWLRGAASHYSAPITLPAQAKGLLHPSNRRTRSLFRNWRRTFPAKISRYVGKKKSAQSVLNFFCFFFLCRTCNQLQNNCTQQTKMSTVTYKWDPSCMMVKQQFRIPDNWFKYSCLVALSIMYAFTQDT